MSEVVVGCGDDDNGDVVCGVVLVDHGGVWRQRGGVGGVVIVGCRRRCVVVSVGHGGEGGGSYRSGYEKSFWGSSETLAEFFFGGGGGGGGRRRLPELREREPISPPLGSDVPTLNSFESSSVKL
nr:hypothetical protein [Tanacetum cinerariifolium]